MSEAESQQGRAEGPAFEKALDEIEQIIAQVESGQITLEQSLTRYDQGMKLIRHCRSVLDQAETKIKTLSEDGGGELRASDADGDVPPQ